MAIILESTILKGCIYTKSQIFCKPTLTNEMQRQCVQAVLCITCKVILYIDLKKPWVFPSMMMPIFFPLEGTYSGRGITIFLYSLSKIFFRNAVKHDYKRLFPIWQILMIARCGEFVTSYVKTELAITSATV